MSNKNEFYFNDEPPIEEQMNHETVATDQLIKDMEEIDQAIFKHEYEIKKLKLLKKKLLE